MTGKETELDAELEKACVRWVATRPAAEVAIRRVLAGKGASFDCLSRAVVVTAFGGHYEAPAGHTIALNGSPVKAVIMRFVEGDAMIWRDTPGPRRLNETDTATVWRYLDSLQMPASQRLTPYPFTVYVDGERAAGQAFDVKPWFEREPELYERLTKGNKVT